MCTLYFTNKIYLRYLDSEKIVLLSTGILVIETCTLPLYDFMETSVKNSYLTLSLRFVISVSIFYEKINILVKSHRSPLVYPRLGNQTFPYNLCKINLCKIPLEDKV